MDHTRRHFLTVAAAIGVVTLPPANTLAQARVPARGQPPVGAGADGELFAVRSADGTVLAAEATGDPTAPEVLFIHGLRQSRLSWDKQFTDPALAGFHMVRFDLRGHGDSDKPRPWRPTPTPTAGPMMSRP